jgi:predicted RNA-binding protein with EMAP domain|tara:strand:- start:228 stop:446 length:219 start_codon:yes stop_codon:yes gene_type:complete
MNKTKMINSLKELPSEIQNLIYNEYLEKQRYYHIKRLNEKSKLYNLVIDEINDFVIYLYMRNQYITDILHTI